MKINSQIIFLIAIVGIIAAGVVGATLLNNGSMKQVDFDGIKVNVPSDSNFVKTADGYADSKYGITIHTFKNNDSMVNFLKGVTGASVISLKNQPPQSVAFVQGDNTNILLTNGAEGISIGAKDQGLVTDMSNSVVFSNHQKSVKPKVAVPGIAPPPHLEFNFDFDKINALVLQVNNEMLSNRTLHLWIILKLVLYYNPQVPILKYQAILLVLLLVLLKIHQFNPVPMALFLLLVPPLHLPVIVLHHPIINN